MRALVLRFDAPLASFGGVRIDNHGVVERFPGTSMLTGLLANALGWRHGEADRLTELQGRVTFAARWDVPPIRLIDYHTVDLGQPKMMGYPSSSEKAAGWTTWGFLEERAGGTAKKAIHERYQHYWADGVLTLALTLKGEGQPFLEDLEAALRYPARPLFLGRKACLPSRPLVDPLQPMVEGEDLRQIISAIPLLHRGEPAPSRVEVCWPGELGLEGMSGQLREVFDLRDWKNQVASGSRLQAEGWVAWAGEVMPA
ncbi:MAG: type I-E CRISPR-associated protein Cas5/CasD [Bacillota bacterium]|nr:type I-E CRISPR-associated protein Cas5/CasD [Bacillota bacterium]